MYFRYKKSASGKTLQLLESYRNEQGLVRNRVVVSLGNANIPENERKSIALAIEEHYYSNTKFLIEIEKSTSERHWIDNIIRKIDREGRWRPYSSSINHTFSPEISPAAEEVVNGVLINDVNHMNSTTLGPELVGLQAWNELQITEHMAHHGWNKLQIDLAMIAVINRLVEPVSENALNNWLATSSLQDLLRIGAEEVYSERFYRISDKLLKNKQSIEQHLRLREENIFNLDRSILLYDLTNSYFEGSCQGNTRAKRGHSKEKRDDCPQVVAGLVLDQNGFGMAHKVFDGNMSDSKSLVEMIDSLKEELKSDLHTPLIIMDAGVATKKNLDLLKGRNLKYLVNDSRRKRKSYLEDFATEEGFKEVAGREGKQAVRVKQIIEGGERILLCKSDNRMEKEKAIRSQAEERFVKALEKLAQRVSKGQLKDTTKVQRTIGRIQARNGRVQGYYQVDIIENTEVVAEKANNVPNQVVWKRKEESYQSNGELLGCYVLRTNQEQLNGEEIWKMYITLTRAEEAFRVLKSSLGLRPMYHQKAERVDAHIFITVLAYHLLRHITYKLEQHNDQRGWESIKRVLQTHCYSTILLPTSNGQTHRIRKAGIADEQQALIYKRLGINWSKLPKSKNVITKKSKDVVRIQEEG